MDFVNNVDFLPAHGGKRAYRFFQRADFFNAPVRSGIDFIDIQTCALIDFAAALAFITGIGSIGVEAVYCFGQNLCHTGLSRTSGAGKQIGVGQAVLLNGPLEGNRNMLLPDDL